MTTPPRVTADQTADALAAIHDRHAAVDDRHAEELTGEPAEVLAYLRKHGPTMPDGIQVDDLDDAVTLHLWEGWQAGRRERWLFDRAVTLHVDRRKFAGRFGVTSLPGFQNRRDRLHALHDDTGPGRPDEKAVVADRVAAREPDAGGWYAVNRDRMREIADAVLVLGPRVDDDTYDQLIEVRREVKRDVWDEMSIVWLSATSDALADSEVSSGWPETAELGAALAELLADRKRSTAASQSDDSTCVVRP
jgi:hypothetical protein